MSKLNLLMAGLSVSLFAGIASAEHGDAVAGGNEGQLNRQCVKEIQSTVTVCKSLTQVFGNVSITVNGFSAGIADKQNNVDEYCRMQFDNDDATGVGLNRDSSKHKKQLYNFNGVWSHEDQRGQYRSIQCNLARDCRTFQTPTEVVRCGNDQGGDRDHRRGRRGR